MSLIKKDGDTDVEWVKGTCKPGSGSCCSYFGASAQGFECLKESGLKAAIDARRAAGTMNAKGDNCTGYDAEKAKMS